MTVVPDTDSSVRPRRVFISYAHSDAAVGEGLADDLRLRGLEVFSPRSLEAGDHWLSAVSKAISHADACIVLVSTASARASGVAEEASLAVGQALTSAKTIVLPVKLDDAAIPFPLSQFQALYADRWANNPERLGSAVAAALERGSTSVATIEAIEKTIAIESAALEYERFALAAESEARAQLVRRWVGASLLALLAALIAAVIWGLAVGGAKWIDAIVAPATAVIGSLVGFYFGSARKT